MCCFAWDFNADNVASHRSTEALSFFVFFVERGYFDTFSVKIPRNLMIDAVIIRGREGETEFTAA